MQAGLRLRWSPRQIAERLPLAYPNDPEMRVSHETIYASLYVQGRGALRKDLTVCLRTGRALRKPHKRVRGETRGKIPNMISISERPPEVTDRAVPGHWEGDLIIGLRTSAIGTLVERTSRSCCICHRCPATGRAPEGTTVLRLPDTAPTRSAKRSQHNWRPCPQRYGAR